MSADLQFRQSLPQLRLPSRGDIATIQTSEIDDTDKDCGCRTPNSAEHKIPANLSCPPAPRKPARALACKRRLSELEFFEIVARDEIESFFRSSFELVSKRRCPCT